MARAYLSLGSNLGDRARHLAAGVAALPGVVAVSGVYETAPVGGPAGQGPYLNLVVAVDTDLSARQLLEAAQRCEQEAGRVRTERWGPRTLDVDLLLYDDAEIHEPDLDVPHPRLWQRRFVVAPLAEVAPELVPADRLEAAEGAVERVGSLDEATAAGGRAEP